MGGRQPFPRPLCATPLPRCTSVLNLKDTNQIYLLKAKDVNSQKSSNILKQNGELQRKKQLTKETNTPKVITVQYSKKRLEYR